MKHSLYYSSGGVFIHPGVTVMAAHYLCFPGLQPDKGQGGLYVCVCKRRGLTILQGVLEHMV